MDKESKKEWLKAIGKFAKAMFRLMVTLVALVTKFTAIGFAKISEWSLSLSDRLE